MKCPACFNALTAQQAGQVTVDICEGGCGGIWLDAFELQRLGNDPSQDTEFLLQIGRDPSLHPDLSRKRECPRCAGVKLKRRFFSPKRQVEIDECPGCGGLWLDAGELERIQQELDQTRRVEQSHRPAQLTMTVIRQLYRIHLERREDDR